MTSCSVSRLLERLADEVFAMASQAGELDQAIPAAIALLPPDRRVDFLVLQSIDMHHQYLTEIGRVLINVAGLIDKELNVSVEILIRNIKLEHFKSILHTGEFSAEDDRMLTKMQIF